MDYYICSGFSFENIYVEALWGRVCFKHFRRGDLKSDSGVGVYGRGGLKTQLRSALSLVVFGCWSGFHQWSICTSLYGNLIRIKRAIICVTGWSDASIRVLSTCYCYNYSGKVFTHFQLTIIYDDISFNFLHCIFTPQKHSRSTHLIFTLSKPTLVSFVVSLIV